MQHGAFRTDSIKDRVDTEELSGLLFGRSGYRYSREKSSCRLQPSCQLDFQQLEMAYLVAPHIFKVHSPSNLRGSCNFHQIQANEFCWSKLASAYFRLCVEDDRSKFSLCSCKI